MKTSYWLMRFALALLLLGMFFGHLASESYRFTDATQGILPFHVLRPLHVSSAYFGIIIGGLACVSLAFFEIFPNLKLSKWLKIHLFLWFISISGIFYSYFTKDFSGREYWEFNPIWALPIFLSFVIFLFFILKNLLTEKKWPSYYWMWFTGVVFFLFVFLENYLWIFPYFKNDLISDLTLQWKVNGSIVGAVNQLLYGFSLYLMTKISGNSEMARKKIAFALYFLGLFNLMFNWGHHIYLVPTSRFIHHLSYIVSMTEWIIFIKIIIDWKKQLSEAKKYYYFFPYRFLMASEYWVAINLFLALLLSIPAVNLFTHGTHITVAHAMGTTIGINMMIILAGAFYYIQPEIKSSLAKSVLHFLFWIIQMTLFVFLVILVVMGLEKSSWQFQESSITFSQHQESLSSFILGFVISGTLLFFSLGGILIYLIIKSFAIFHNR